MCVVFADIVEISVCSPCRAKAPCVVRQGRYENNVAESKLNEPRARGLRLPGGFFRRVMPQAQHIIYGESSRRIS